MRIKFETMNNEPTAQTSGDQGRGWYATRVWHSNDGELTCVRFYLAHESREHPERLQ